MSLINVTREQRNGKASVSDDLIQTDKIALPIREIGGKAYISVVESPLTGRGSENLVISDYLVGESLDTVVAQSASLFKATVTSRDGRTPISGYDVLGFVSEKIMGPIMTEGSGSRFLYHEDNATHPAIFIVSEAPAAIVAQTGTGEMPTADPLQYTALISQTGTDAPVATILKNTLGGTPVWTRAALGTYNLTLVGAFPDDKVVINGSSGESSGGFKLDIYDTYDTINRFGAMYVRGSDDLVQLVINELNADAFATGTTVDLSTYFTLGEKLLVDIVVYP